MFTQFKIFSFCKSTLFIDWYDHWSIMSYPGGYSTKSFIHIFFFVIIAIVVFYSFNVFPAVILGHTTGDLWISVQSIGASLILNISERPGYLALLSRPASFFFFVSIFCSCFIFYMYTSYTQIYTDIVGQSCTKHKMFSQCSILFTLFNLMLLY